MDTTNGRIATSRRVRCGTRRRVAGSLRFGIPTARACASGFRREREALRLWAAEQTKIENGTWDEPRRKNVTVADALKQYRDVLEGPAPVARHVHRALAHAVGSAPRPQTLLAKISPRRSKTFKLKRAQKVAHSTVDKDLAVLKAFFNWCIAQRLAASNPVRRVKLFHEDNSRLRYLTREEYDRLIEAARTLETVALPEEKIVLAAHTGLRRGSLFNLRWEQIDFANSVMRIPRTKSGRPALGAAERYGHVDAPAAPFASGCLIHPYVFPHTLGRERRRSRCRTSRTASTRHWSSLDRGLHLARPAAHVRVVADDARRLAAQRR